MIRFEPGDATSYLVDFRYLTREEAQAIGGYGFDNTPVLFSFGSGDGPLVTMHFQGSTHGALQFDYYIEKMYQRNKLDNPWTITAGYIVLCHLSARPMLFQDKDADLITEVQNRWEDSRQYWRSQVQSLLKHAEN